MKTSGLNFRHLYYFWVVAKEGGVTRAADGQAVLDAAGKPVMEAQVATTQTIADNSANLTLGTASLTNAGGKIEHAGSGTGERTLFVVAGG